MRVHLFYSISRVVLVVPAQRPCHLLVVVGACAEPDFSTISPLQLQIDSTMSDSEPKPAEGIQDTTPPTETTSQPVTVDRTDLVEKARTFLHSPQVRSEDNAAKRKFLVEKGLTDVEIEGLLRELVSRILWILPLRHTHKSFVEPAPAPVIPPRTYPQPPPSNLPNLLIGLARIISWIVGGSAAVLFMYFVSPR